MTTGSWYHMSVKTIGRSAGRSATAAVAYRLGERIHDEATDRTHDYRARSGIETSFTLAPGNAPEWAHDPERLWNAAEAAEKRKNSTLAREVELALPANVTPEARLGIVQAFSQGLVERYGVAVTAAIHQPGSEGDQRNHHAHIMFTTREFGEDGFGTKTRLLDDRKTGPEEVSYMRHFAADLINETLADSGSDERVDHRSFKDRGIDEEPTTHEGPAATSKKRRGEESDRGDANLEVAEENAQREKMNALVDELAELDEQIAKETAAQFENDLLLRQNARATHDQAEEVAWSFEALHAQKLRQAQTEMEDMAAERSSRWSDAIGKRVERVGVWWQNMRESFTEWRSHLQENVTNWFDRTHGEEQKPPEPEAITAQTASSEPTFPPHEPMGPEQ